MSWFEEKSNHTRPISRLLSKQRKEYIMKNILLGLIMSVMMFPAVAGTINGNLSYNSDYVWRGVTQTQGGTSVHGQFEIVSAAGFYTGLYGAQVEFADDDKTSKELDYYAGFDLQVSDNVSLDTGYVRYTYDASVIESFEEIYAILNIGGLQIAGYQNLDDNDNYAEIQYSFGWLFDNAFDLTLIHGLHDEKNDAGRNFTMVRFNKLFGSQDQFNFGVTFGEDVFEGQTADSVFASLTYNFSRNI